MNAIIINPSKEKWPQLIQRPQFNTAELEASVSEILETVKQKGDEALKSYSLQFDGFAPDNLMVSPDEILAATISIDKDLKKAILVAKNNIEKFHRESNTERKRNRNHAGGCILEKKCTCRKCWLIYSGRHCSIVFNAVNAGHSGTDSRV